MIRRPPRSTLFPTRRSSDLRLATPRLLGALLSGEGVSRGDVLACLSPTSPLLMRGALRFVERSEEHTSELQSRRDLVCRLLLEKKKKTREGRECTWPTLALR